MFLATGEWWHSNLYFGLVWLAVVFGVSGVGWYVLHMDARNRAAEAAEDSVHQETAHH